MELRSEIQQFVEHPFPLWETTLTHQLVQYRWKVLESNGFARFNYSTACIWLNDPILQLDEKKDVFEKDLFVELPSHHMQSFYDEHGLELLTANEIEADSALLKLNKAFYILRLIEPAYDCITNLVRAIHILRQPDQEIDLSYSHPNIPFSIFVSVCADDSTISSLRVAESILHEAMHLKLTLIENIVPLVQTENEFLYYSPWRNEKRPVRGIIHGLFVFRAIYELCKKLANGNKIKDAKEYLQKRNKQIEYELSTLKDFHLSSGLTKYGASLVANLLPLN